MAARQAAAALKRVCPVAPSVQEASRGGVRRLLVVDDDPAVGAFQYDGWSMPERLAVGVQTHDMELSLSVALAGPRPERPFDCIECRLPLPSPTVAAGLLTRLQEWLAPGGEIVVMACAAEPSDEASAIASIAARLNLSLQDWARIESECARAAGEGHKAVLTVEIPSVPQTGHSRYDVFQLAALAATVGLTTRRCLPTACYDPAPVVGVYPPVRSRLAVMEGVERTALGFDLYRPKHEKDGYAPCHVMVLGRTGDACIDPVTILCEYPDSVPVLRGCSGLALAMGMTADHRLPVRIGARDLWLHLPPQARGIFPLLDGQRTVATLAVMLESRGVNAAQFQDVWARMVTVLTPIGVVVRA